MTPIKMITILSLGAGVQSTVMALMAETGEIPKPDAAIFADTGWEPIAVYEHLKWLENQLSFPVYRVSKGNIRDDLLEATSGGKKRFASIPYFTENGGMGRRQCTKEYKLYPIRDKAKKLLNHPSGKRIPKGAIKMLIGISTDEASRMKPSTVGYIEHQWPLIDLGMSRQKCISWFNERYPGRALAKSACIGCPYHNDAMWRDMKTNDPDSFANAVDADNNMRNNMRNKEYMHRSLKALAEVDFRNLEDRGQLNMFENECEGMCGV